MIFVAESVQFYTKYCDGSRNLWKYMTVSMYGKWLQIVLFLFLWVLFSCLIFVWFYWLLDSNVYIKKNFFLQSQS